jgi:hypothetical protein
MLSIEIQPGTASGFLYPMFDRVRKDRSNWNHEAGQAI